jgi:pimeloyl-ACP methyl ester carboxylesterase
MSILAGLILLTLGAVVLWTSRRRADALVWRYTRRVLMTAGVAFIVMAVLFPIALSYVVTHTLRADVPTADLGTAHQDVEFVTGDGLTLRGWYIPSKNGAAVIAFPGRGASQQQAKLLADHGYGVLLFDRRGEGESEGDPNLFGWQGERDVLAAVDFLQERDDVDPQRIGAIGLSVGGEILIEAATKTTALKAIVVEGASGRSVRDALVNRDEPWWGLPSLAISSASTALFTNTLPPADLKGLVSRISPRAVFFVYGERGQPAEKPANEGFYAAAGQPKMIWEVPGAKHMGGIAAQPREYEQRIIAFFDAHLPDTR